MVDCERKFGWCIILWSQMQNECTALWGCEFFPLEWISICRTRSNSAYESIGGYEAGNDKTPFSNHRLRAFRWIYLFFLRTILFVFFIWLNIWPPICIYSAFDVFIWSAFLFFVLSAMSSTKMSIILNRQWHQPPTGHLCNQSIDCSLLVSSLWNCCEKFKWQIQYGWIKAANKPKQRQTSGMRLWINTNSPAEWRRELCRMAGRRRRSHNKRRKRLARRVLPTPAQTLHSLLNHMCVCVLRL